MPPAVAPTILSWGELLWDLYPDQRRLGGCAANVAYHTHQLGDRAVLVSRVGNDELGRSARAEVEHLGIDAEHVQVDAEAVTGSVRVRVEKGEPKFSIAEQAAWDRIELTDEVRQSARRADAICFGTLAQRTQLNSAALDGLLQEVPSGCHKVCDLNIRLPFATRSGVDWALERATAVKLNTAECDRLTQLFGMADPVTWMIEDRNVSVVALTRGKSGSLLVSAEERIDHPGETVEIGNGDAVGAGDAFTAVLTHHLAAGSSLAVTSDATNAYAAFVATQPGAMPPVPAAIRAAGLGVSSPP